MLKKISVLVAGAVFLILLTLGIYLAISLELIFPASVIEWIGASGNPRLALWIASCLFASFVITTLKVGVKLPFLKPWVERPDHPFFTYLFGLPLEVVLSILILSGIGQFILRPVCDSPFANIEVISLNDDIIEFNGKLVTAKAGAKITLVANVNNNAVVFCSWSSTGTAIKTIGPKSSCTTQASLSNEPDRGIITLTLSSSFCSLKSTSPLEILVVP